MALFEHFPYTNFHNLNLDWIIAKIKSIDGQFEEAAQHAADAEAAAEAAAGSSANAANYADAADRSAQSAEESLTAAQTAATTAQGHANTAAQAVESAVRASNEANAHAVAAEASADAAAAAAASITVDSAMSTTSEAPLQNKVITQAFNALPTLQYTVDTQAGTELTTTINGLARTFYNDRIIDDRFNALPTIEKDATAPQHDIVITIQDGSVSGASYTITDFDGISEWARNLFVQSANVSSTVTSGTGHTNPVNSDAVIAYINSLDATSTAY